MNVAPPDGGPVNEVDRWEQAKAIKAAWQAGAVPDTDAAVRACPALEDEVVLLDLAYEEWRLRRDSGQEVDPDAFCEQFPTVRSALRRQLNLDGTFSSTKGSMPPEYRRLLMEPERWPEVGERLGEYTLVRELGRGAFARVFLAREASTGNRPVVVKLSVGGEYEAHTLGRLAHPNIVPIWSCRRDEATGLDIVCMPFLGAATLEDVLDRVHRDRGEAPRRAAELLEAARSRCRPDDPPVPDGQPEPLLVQGSFATGVLHLGARLAEALDFLHARQVCHQDLKPSNVLLGPGGVPRLLDFNLAVEPDAEIAFLGGTLHYAAPEHVRAMLHAPDAPRPDGRSDVFALGVILHELLTGRNPFGRLPRGFSSRELGEMLIERQKAGCPLPQARGLTPAAARLVGRCLAFDPAERPTARELAAGLRDAVGPGRLRRWAARHTRALWALACLLPVVLGAAVAGSRDGSPEVRLPREAGVQAYNEGRYAEAEEHFARALTVDPDNLQLRLDHGLALLKASERPFGELDDYQLSLARLEFELVQADSPLARACLAYEHLYRVGHNSRPKPAIDLTERDARTGVATTATLNNLACAYLQGKDQLGAAEAALNAIASEADRQLPAVRYNRAILALKRRVRSNQPVPREALEDVQAVLDTNPPRWEPYHQAAILCAYAAEDDRRRRALLCGPFAALSGDPTPLAGTLTVLQARWREQVIAHLRSALELGMDPGRCSDFAWTSWPDVVDHPDFKALQARKRAQGALPTSSLPLRLINPAPRSLD